jgi:hypothetical protein
MSMSVNLPFERVVSAGHRQRSGGVGDLPLKMDGQTRPSWIVLWPHVRPWRFAPAQPMLRSVPDSGSVAELLATALREFSGQATGSETTVRVAREDDSKTGMSVTPGLGAGAPSAG